METLKRMIKVLVIISESKIPIVKMIVWVVVLVLHAVLKPLYKSVITHTKVIKVKKANAIKSANVNCEISDNEIWPWDKEMTRLEAWSMWSKILKIGKR